MRSVVVTGISRGLGRALAEELRSGGAQVVGCARTGPTSVDVSDFAQVQAWAREVLAGPGPPDLLVNNAALINRNARLWEVPVEEFSDVIDVNLKGVYHVIRAFLPAMLERGRGVIVNLSSGWGRSTSPEVAPYCCTKWGIEGLTQALAQELPQGMAAVALNPGVIDTDMLRSCFGSSAAHYPGPQEWARRAAPFLLALGPQHNGKSLSVPM